MYPLPLRTALPLLLAIWGCAGIEPIVPCTPIGAATPLCGYQNPEDLALLPGGRHVLVSEYGGMHGERSGRISLLTLESRKRRVLFESNGADHVGAWGAQDCLGPPEGFSPHGIDLSQRPDGTLQLLAVQHGSRESVEFFEVKRTAGHWRLAWRGCAEPPPGHNLNDVVALPEGGFLVTHMRPPDSGRWLLARAALFGKETGYVLEWQRDVGFAEVPGTRGVLPNGIEVSEDGEKIFLNQSLANSVSRIDRRSGRVEARAEVPVPDNSTWAPDGRLLVASLRGTAREMTSCPEISRGSCPARFAIVALDPVTLEGEVIYEGGVGTPSGGGTVGLDIGEALLIGTFAGDRIVWVEKAKD